MLLFKLKIKILTISILLVSFANVEGQILGVHCYNQNTPVSILQAGQAFYSNNLPANTTLKVYTDRGQIVYKQENYQNNYYPVLASATYEIALIFDNGTTKASKLVVVK